MGKIILTAGQFAQSAALKGTPAGNRLIGYEKSYDNQPHIFSLTSYTCDHHT